MKAIISRNVCANRLKMYYHIKEKLDQGKLVYLIVPEQFTLGTEIEAFNILDLESTINFRVTSFTKLINDIIFHSNIKNKNFISDQARYLFIQSILLERRKDLLVFGRNRANKEFSDLVIKTIDQILDNKYDLYSKNYDYIAYINSLIDNDNLDQSIKNKLKDLAIVIDEYQKIRIKSNFLEYDKYEMAASILQDGIKKGQDRSNEFLLRLAHANYFYYSFSSMNKKEMNILKNLANLSYTNTEEASYINLTLDPDLLKDIDIEKISDYEVFEEARKFYMKLSDTMDLKAEIVDNKLDNQKDIEGIDQENNELLEKERKKYNFINSIFKFNKNEIDKRFGIVYDYEDKNKFAFNSREKAIDNVYINRSNNTDDEVEKLAIEIKKDIYEKNYKFGEIAVICTDQNEYFNKIRSNFQINRIPAFFDEKRRLMDNVIYKYIKTCISILEFGLNPDSASQLLKYSFWTNNQSINLYQDYIKRRKLHGKDLLDPDRFYVEKTSHYQDEDKENLRILSDSRHRLEEILNRLDYDIFEMIEDADPIDSKTFVSCLYKFVANPTVLESYENYAASISNEEYEENRLVWKSFINLLDDMHLLNISTSLDQLVKLTNAAVDNFKIGLIPPAHDKVFIGNISKTKINNVKKLYIVGMSNLYYPPRNQLLDIFSENEKEDLAQLGIEFMETRESTNQRNLLSFYELLNSYEDELVFSFSLVNSSNEPMNMAYLLNTIRKIILKENYNASCDNPEEYFYSLTRLGQYMPKLKKKDNNLTNKESILYSKYSDLLDRYPKYDSIEKSLNFIDRINFKKENISKLDRNIALDLFNFDRFSVSQLEKYNTNPYDHFISYGLRPREYDVFDISNREVGNIAHEFLDQFLKNRHDKDKDLDDIFQKSLEKSLEEYKKQDYRNIYYLGQMNKNFKAYARHIENQLSITKDIEVMSEVKFGYSGKEGDVDKSIRPLSVMVDYDGKGEKEVKLYGKIDRVDIINYDKKENNDNIDENDSNESNKSKEKYYRVVDYKTGTKKFSPSKVMKGIDMQLLLYLNAMINQDDLKDETISKKALGAFYQRLNTNLISMNIEDDSTYEIAKENDVFRDLDLDGILSDNYDLIVKTMGVELEAENPIEEKKQNLYKLSRGNKLGSQKNIIEENLFDILFEKNIEKIKETIKDIGEGKIDLKTYREGNSSPYDFSPYRTISKDEGLKYEYFDSYSWKDFQKDLTYLMEQKKVEKRKKEGQDE